jgi:hypothetical protein
MFAALSLAGPQKRRWPARFAALLAIVVITGARVAGAADGPWMNEDQMRAAFSGVTLEGKYGSGKPFTEVYEKDGSLQYRETQTVIGGKWSVQAGTLCTIYDNDPTGGCYRVKQVGANCFEFYFVARSEAQAQSDQKRPSWTARGSVVGKPGICAEEHSV